MKRVPASAADLPAMPVLDRMTLDRQAYRVVREALMSGRLRPGQAITLRGLAEALGVSRQPVGAALTRLETEGALLASPVSGRLYVPSLTPAELQELLEIRVHLEGLAARKAARLITPEELEDVRARCRVLEAEADAADCRGYAMANWAFHAAVYRSSHSPMLCSAIEPFWLRIGPYVELMMPDRASLMASIPTHWQVVDALARRDEAEAEAAIARDLSESAHALMALLRAAPPAPSRPRALPGLLD
ncbi:GntR family transcriptional regulator [Rhodovarius crocodyli]|nr:GntR family transcriptional regulator [Rhodovarius crocodyli]